jgi:hypothetical protein
LISCPGGFLTPAMNLPLSVIDHLNHRHWQPPQVRAATGMSVPRKVRAQNARIPNVPLISSSGSRRLVDAAAVGGHVGNAAQQGVRRHPRRPKDSTETGRSSYPLPRPRHA